MKNKAIDPLQTNDKKILGTSRSTTPSELREMQNNNPTLKKYFDLAKFKQNNA